MPEVEPVLPEVPDDPPDEPPDEPPCPKASEAWVSRTAVMNASVFDCIVSLRLGANARCCHPFRAAANLSSVKFRKKRASHRRRIRYGDLLSREPTIALLRKEKEH